ncbi:helix-turn-helix domain-containing protein [Streptomyces sp. NPDC020141]|uniref:nSTAND1 domain-containing NTPase n=1 Tax=Streptomyces sp. NPDC020141 TaxID=3365065 RepID=UPI0037A40F8F
MPVDPAAGPVERFAYELRKLRQETDGLTYRAMARTVPYSVTTLSRAAAGEQLPSLPVVLAYVRACGCDEDEQAEWEERWRAASGEATARDLADDGAAADSPYQGLARFEPGDHERFFGRGPLIDAARDLVLGKRFAAVFGPSGSGKSSLLRAGLIPVLRDRAGELAAIRVLTPGPHPMRAHADALIPKDGGGDTLVVVDQFEEVFTLCTDPAERAEFVERLLAAREPGSRLRVVIAVRADFYARCAGNRSLADALADASLLVGPMTQAELRETVIGPAQAAGLIVERELTARLIADVDGEPGGLPLLSHALRETWRRRRGRTLTMAAYEATGGAHGAIAHTAEEAYADLSAEQRELARLVLLRLITPGDGAPDTRRPVPCDELCFGDSAETALIVERLVRARLLTLRDEAADLAHEALITAWPRLSAWIEEDRERIRAHRRLTEAAQIWCDLGQDTGALYWGAQLTAAEQHFTRPEYAAALTAPEQAFLRASRTTSAAVRRRRRALLSSLVLVLAVALVAGVIAWQQNATGDRRHTEAEARRIASVADALRHADPQRAMRLSVAAWRLADTTETRSALTGAMAQREEDVFTVSERDTDTSEGLLLTGDGRTLIAAGPDRVQSWDLRDPRRTRVHPGPGSQSGWGAVIASDGRSMALQSEDGSVLMWDVRAGRAAGRIPVKGTTDLALGLDGASLAVMTDHGDVEVWDVGDRRRRLTVASTYDAPSATEMTLSRDGRKLALCLDRGPLQIWDVATRERLDGPWTKAGRPDCAWGEAALAPDGRSVAVATGEGVRRWDLGSGRELPRLVGGRARVVRFSADGAFLTASGPGELRLWRLSSPGASVFHHALANEEVEEFALDPADGSLRYLDGNELIVRSLRPGRATTDEWSREGSLDKRLSPDGRTLALVSATITGDGFRLVDAGSGRTVGEPPGRPCVPEDASHGGTVAMHCDGHSVFSADGRYYAYWDSASDRLVIWDVAARRTHASVRPDPGDDGLSGVNDFELSADGRRAYTARAEEDRELVEVWDVSRAGRGRKTATVPGIGGPPLALRRDETGLAGAGGGYADLRAGRPSSRGMYENGAQTQIFSPDGSRLAVGDNRGRVTIWDGRAVKRLAIFQGVENGVDGDAPDDVAEPAVVSRRPNEGGVTALAFSPDGTTLAVGDGWGSVQLWDVASSRRLGSPLPTPGDAVLSLAFGADGRTLRSAGVHSGAETYDLDPGRMAAAVCERAGSGLSRTEWRDHLPELPYRETC